MDCVEALAARAQALVLMGAEMVPGAAETDIAGAVELPIGCVAGIPD